MKIPKIILTLAVLTLALNASIASNLEPTPFTISAINFSMDLSTMNAHAIEIEYQEKNGNLSFTTQKEITFLQILNETNELEFQLPVDSKRVILDLNDLSKGKYKLNLILEGQTIVPGSFSKE